MLPTSRLSFDVPSHEEPIITAESPAALIAMRKLLMDESDVWHEWTVKVCYNVF